MSTMISKGNGQLDKDEYEFFICESQDIDLSSCPPNPCKWLPQSCWNLIVQLDKLPTFIGITGSIDQISRNWHEWYLTAEPENIFLPGKWRNCTEFEKLLIVRCLRVDRITSCIRNYVVNNLGRRFLEYPQMSLKKIMKESISNKPIVLFVLSADIDSEAIVSELAEDFEMSEKYRAISLGQGQEPLATQLIIDAAKLGYWAYISNCHLLPSWLPALEKIVNKLRTIKLNPDFRLFLGSSPSELFPTSILQNSLVLTLDEPKGIKANMTHLYKTDLIRESDLSDYPQKYRSLLFSLSFFHSVLVERQKFQNLGWNANYKFLAADFKTSLTMLQTYLTEYEDNPWDALRNGIAEVCYKNRLLDKWDERLLMTYYEEYFCDEACSTANYLLSSLNTYYIPENGPLEHYVQYIKSLPRVDAVEIFGQHANAEIPFRVQEGESLLQHLSKIQGDTLISKEAYIEHKMLKTVEDLKQNIPNLINEEASENVLLEKPDPFSFILVQETRRYNVLLKLVMASLNDLENGILGKQKMTEKGEEFLMCVKKMEVPKEWQLAYLSLKPLGSWIADLKLRVDQFKSWSSTGTPPIIFWLPGFTSPRSLLNATLLSTVQDNDVMFQELELEFHVSTLDESYIKESPVDGIYVGGLFLEGAGWDKPNCILVDPNPLHSVNPLPMIHFKPVLETTLRGLYTCPCFYTSRRINDDGSSSYLFSIELKTKKSQDYWIKRGTAIIMSSKE